MIEQNYAVDGGEIDIIAIEKDSDTVCFVEVKYRSSDERGLPIEAVNRTKRKRIAHAARAYLKAKRALGAPYRFDVVSVLETDGSAPEVELYRNAFVPSRSGWSGGAD